MYCWGELKRLRAQSLGEVSTNHVRAINRVKNKHFSGCGNEIPTRSQPGLEQVEKLVTPCLVTRGSEVQMIYPKPAAVVVCI